MDRGRRVWLESAVACAGQVLIASLAALMLHGCSPQSSSAAGPSTRLESPIIGRVALDVAIWGGGPRLAISVAPMGAPMQKLVLDTGSSTLAFCDTSLADRVQARATTFFSCNKYGMKGEETSYWGKFYQGSLTVGDAHQSMEIDSAFYSMMQAESGMPCADGFQGIFGLAFVQLDGAFEGGDADIAAFSSGTCPAKVARDLVPPLLGALRSSRAPATLGIYWSGALGVDEGALFFDSAAIANEHTQAGTPAGDAALGEVGWYDVTVQEIALTGSAQVWTDYVCKPGSFDCILDTGTPSITVPLEVFDSVNDLLTHGVDPGMLQFTLAGAQQGPSVVLQVPVSQFFGNGWITAGKSSGIILGLPLWSLYYTVMHLDTKSVAFVALSGSQVVREPVGTTTVWWQAWPIFDADNSSDLLSNSTVAQKSGRGLSQSSSVLV